MTYPFYLLSTNRMLPSAIQRKNLKRSATFKSDFKDLYRMNRGYFGIFGLYIGFMPYIITNFLKIYKDY